LIIKNIWHRRTTNAWLFIELIIVTIVTWVIIDPVVVTVSDKMLPLGYDEERLLYITLKEQPNESPAHIESEDNDESRKTNIESVIKKLRTVDGIESVARLPFKLNEVFMIEKYVCGDSAIDSLKKQIFSFYFSLNDGALSAIGAEAAEGCPSIEELEKMQFGYYDIILPESVDRFYFPDHRGVNEKYLTEKLTGSDYEIQHKVVGVLKDLRPVKSQRNTAIVYHNDNRPSLTSPQFIIRLNQDINPDEFIKDNTEKLRELVATGNYYLWDIASVIETNKQDEVRRGITAKQNLRIALAALFLINLMLGVIGTVWLQTRRRISEIGIYRTFGALKINVRTMLIGENIILSTVAIIIGLLLYFQYAHKEGLFDSAKNAEHYIQNYSWVADFAPHFAIVSAIVAAIILLCVAIGTYLPARKASNIEPVDALRDE
ncbi:MAG: ABC transporter permease, partial [Muribaculaceae bacterium]|nr:ABC transporter permease [Muribaculaceae bacterium]